MRTFILGALLASTVAVPAMAQESAPFTGPYVNGIIGYDTVKGGEDDLDDSRDGVLYGGQLGYDFQLGGAIAGIEAELSDSSTRARASDVTDGITTNASLAADRDLYIGARIGFAVAPSTMLYAKGGYTNARFKFDFNDGTTAFNEGLTADGYRLGAGIEQKLNLFGPSGFVKAEYRYSNYKNLDISIGDDEIDDVNIDADRHQVLVGVGVRF
ncbi:MAG: outer membrane protein [Sphingomonadaceae bacterium]